MTARKIQAKVEQLERQVETQASKIGELNRRNLAQHRRIGQQDTTIMHLNSTNAALRGELQAANKRLATLTAETRLRHAYEEAGQ